MYDCKDIINLFSKYYELNERALLREITKKDNIMFYDVCYCLSISLF